MAGRRTSQEIARPLLAVVLGLLVPLALLFQAHEAIKQLDDLVDASSQIEAVASAMPAKTRSFASANDYAVFSLALVESSNFRALANKQRMKIAVIHIGFAVASAGLLFIMLGVDQGGVEASATAEGKVGYNLKIASTGLAVFVLGASLAGAGGLLPNQYSTAGIPGYGGMPMQLEPETNLKHDEVSACVKYTADDNSLNICLRNLRSKQKS